MRTFIESWLHCRYCTYVVYALDSRWQPGDTGADTGFRKGGGGGGPA